MNSIRQLLRIVEGTPLEYRVREWIQQHVRVITHEHILDERAVADHLPEAQSSMLRAQVRGVTEELIRNHTQIEVRSEHLLGQRKKFTKRTISLLVDTPPQS